MFPQLGSRASQALAYLPVPAITGSSPVALSLYSAQRPRRETADQPPRASATGLAPIPAACHR
jgi:hypothetical protein